MSDRDGDFGAFISGFVIGGLVGAAVAVLLAPQSGENTRALIRDRGIEIRDTAYQSAEGARSRASELQQRGHVVLEEQKERLKGAMDAGKQAASRKKAEVTLDSDSAEEAA